MAPRMAVWSLAALMVAGWGCGVALAQKGDLSGAVKVDGSSTVYPITAAAAELFGQQHPKVKVTVGISGTGGGFKKFLEEKAELRTDIQDASRPITAAEQERAKTLGIEFVELPVGYDGIAVVVNSSNTFCELLTIDELKKIWAPESKIHNWKDVRAGFPDLPLKLYGPGVDSGTFEYFTEAVVGKAKACRADFTPSEDDNVLVKGVEGDAGSLGYFGYAYYENNRKKLKLVAIDNGDGKPIKPDAETIRKRSYRPLARPLFLYVNKEALAKPQVKAFLDYYLANAQKIVEHPRVNYVALSPSLYEAIKARLAKQTTGTIYAGAESQTKSLYELYGIEGK